MTLLRGQAMHASSPECLRAISVSVGGEPGRPSRRQQKVRTSPVQTKKCAPPGRKKCASLSSANKGAPPSSGLCASADSARKPFPLVFGFLSYLFIRDSFY